MPFTTATGATYDSGEFARHLDDALLAADAAGFEARRQKARDSGLRRGLGISTYVEACGGGPPEWSTVSVNNDGRLTVLIGNQSNGQGHETAYTQLIAEQLGFDPSMISIVQGDSDLIARGNGTGGSRALPVGGVAVADAATKVSEKARLRAAELMEAADADVAFEEGRFTVVGTDKSMSLAEVAAESPDVEAFREDGRFQPAESTYPNGTHVAEVEIDPATGVSRIVSYVVVDDFGRVMNPMLVQGQVHGGIAPGHRPGVAGTNRVRS